MAIKVYTARYSENIAAGAASTDTMVLNLPGRRITLKSLLITRRLLNIGGNVYIPDEQNTTQNLNVRVGAIAGTFTNAPAAGTGTMGPVNVGNYIEIINPGQYFFNWSDFVNSISFEIAFSNAAAFMVQHNVNFYFEVDDKIIYF